MFEGNERYTLLDELGSGGQGTACLFEDEVLHRQVVIKRINSGEAHGAIMMAKNDNIPGVVHVHDQFWHDGDLYIVMDHVPGVTLAKYIRQKGKLDPRAAVSLLLPVVQAMAALHKSGILHLDINPVNIIVDGKKSTLIDFDSASASENGTLRLDSANAYLAPERLEGRAEACSDVYSLAAALFYAVTGADPVPASQPGSRKPSGTGARIPKQLEDALARGMETDPNKRFRDAGELQNALQDFLSGRRFWRGVGAAAAVFAALTAVLAVAFLVIPAVKQYRYAHHFDGYRTEEVLIEPSDTMKARDLREKSEALEEKLTELSGNYPSRIENEQYGYYFTTALDVFGGGLPAEKMKDELSGGAGEWQFTAQIPAEWYAVQNNPLAGTCQAAAEAVRAPYVDILYAPSEADEDLMRRGNRAKMLLDITERLDAMNISYAAGVCSVSTAGNIVLRVSCRDMSRLFLDTFGTGANACHIHTSWVAEGNIDLQYCSPEAVETEKGKMLRAEIAESDREIFDGMDPADTWVSFEAYSDSARVYRAMQLDHSETGEDGKFFAYFAPLEAGQDWVAEYAAAFAQTSTCDAAEFYMTECCAVSDQNRIIREIPFGIAAAEYRPQQEIKLCVQEAYQGRNLTFETDDSLYPELAVVLQARKDDTPEGLAEVCGGIYRAACLDSRRGGLYSLTIRIEQGGKETELIFEQDSAGKKYSAIVPPSSASEEMAAALRQGVGLQQGDYWMD